MGESLLRLTGRLGHWIILSEMDKGYEIAALMIMIEPHHINLSAIIPFAE